MSVTSEDFTIVEEQLTTARTEPTGQKDEVYYWADNVTFSVEDVLFRVSRYPFLLGSEYFVKKYGLLAVKGDGCAGSVVQLESVTAAQFRVFLKFLFPVHLTSTTSTFTKKEWLTILSVSVGWHFHEARKLAIQHLDGQLTDLELILVGRNSHVPRWVVQGYTSLIERPVTETILESEGDAIGLREVNRLWAIRYRRAVPPFPHDFVGPTLRSVFSEELAELAAQESQYRTKAEIEEMKLAEEMKKKEEEAREAALREREELELERMRIEEEEERRRIEDDEAQREWFEEEEQKMRAEEEALEAMRAEERRRGGETIEAEQNHSLLMLLQETRRSHSQDNGAERGWISEPVVETRTRSLILAEEEQRPVGVGFIAGASRVVVDLGSGEGQGPVTAAGAEHRRRRLQLMSARRRGEGRY